MALLLNQQTIHDQILKSIQENRKLFIIRGNSGTGKSYLMHELSKSAKHLHNFNSLNMEGDHQCTDREFYPIRRCLSYQYKMGSHSKHTAKTGVLKLAKAIPNVGDAVEFGLDQFLNRKEIETESLNSYLNQEELELVFKLQYVIEQETYIFCIDNLQWWDEKSVALLYQLLNERENSLSFLSTAIFIVNWTTDQESHLGKWMEDIAQKFNFEVHSLATQTRDNYGSLLRRLGLNKDIAPDIIELLFSVTGGHLHLSKDAVRYLNSTSYGIDEDMALPENRQLNMLIEQRLKRYGTTGHDITEMLKYASIIGQSFTFFEMENITNKKEHELIGTIQKANDLYLIEVGQKQASFAHEVIRELFHSKLEDNQSTYYKAYAECLKVIRPTEYATRARLLLKAGLPDEAGLIYTLAYIKKIRKKEVVSAEFLNEIAIFVGKAHIHEYLEIMVQAYKCYYAQKFQEAAEHLDAIDTIYPSSLLAEKDYLQALCFSKDIHETSRRCAVDALEAYRNMDRLDNESEIWSRLMSALIIAYIHINDKENALALEKELMFFLGKRQDFDMDAVDKINILRRKSSAVHTTPMAARRTLQSVKHFGPRENGTVPLNPLEYYFALNNHIANTMVCGQFGDSYNYANQVLQLVRNYRGLVTFPRIEVVLNNYALSGLLDNQLSCSRALAVFESIVTAPNRLSYSDRILIEINRALLCAITDDFQTASDHLQRLRRKLQDEENIEIYYDYYIASNLMVIEHLQGNTQAAIGLWHETEDLPAIGDMIYYKRRHRILKKLIEDQIQTNGLDWLDAIHSIDPFQETDDAWGFYGKGYLFSDIQFWSES